MKNLAVAMTATVVLFGCENSENEIKQTVNTQEFETEEAYPNTEGATYTATIGGEDLQLEQYGEDFVYEGDIIYTKEEIQDLESGTEAVGLTGRRWPNGIMYYTISSSLSNQSRVTEAIKHWEDRTSIRFVRRTNQSNYVQFRSGSGCSASLGMRGGRQYINLASGCSTGNTIHEIGHALGLFHEHTRTDRDRHVNVLWNNIRSGVENNFQRADLRYSARDYTPVIDYGSIMMYSSYSFTNNGQPTMVKKDGSTWGRQRRALSSSDISGIEAMY